MLFLLFIFSMQSVFAKTVAVDTRFVLGDDPKAVQLPPNAGVGGGVVSFGGWELSSVTANCQTLWSSQNGAHAVFNPDIQVAGRVRVSYMKLKEKDRENDPNLKIEIQCRGKISTFSIDCEEGTTGWVELGVFDFKGKGEERFHVIKETPDVLSRCGSFLVELLEPGFQNEVTSKYRLVPAAEMIDLKALESVPAFEDMKDGSELRELNFLLRRGITIGCKGKYFYPDKSISGNEFYDLLDSVLKPLDVKATRNLSFENKPALNLEEAVMILNNNIETTKRNIEWLNKRCGADMSSLEKMRKAEIVDEKISGRNADKKPLNRLDAFLLVKRFMQSFVLAGPPISQNWKLTFEENFDGDDLDWKVWNCQNTLNSHILSSRWKENVEVGDGLCRLVAKKETRGGQDWTAASIWVRPSAFSQTYGYWEARYRYANASGLNNAFWMDIPNEFEIDINEGHWPNKINTNLHWYENVDEKRVRITKHESVSVSDDLTENFHTYACQWNDKEIIYYFDGKEIFRKPVQTAHKPVTPILSLAVIFWAGAVTDAIDGKSMDIDWVRVYQLEQQ